MAEEKKHDIPEVAPKVVEHLVEQADKAEVPPAVAKWIIKDAVADGVAPDKVADVVKEAIKVKRSAASSRRGTPSASASALIGSQGTAPAAAYVALEIGAVELEPQGVRASARRTAG
jgi:hypothetical protein